MILWIIAEKEECDWLVKGSGGVTCNVEQIDNEWKVIVGTRRRGGTIVTAMKQKPFEQTSVEYDLKLLKENGEINEKAEGLVALVG